MDRSVIKGLFTLTRPIVNFVTNLYVLVGFLLGKNFQLQNADWVLVAKAYISLCLLYAAIYSFNDLFDRKSDLKHPYKSKVRPIALGIVKPRLAAVMIAVLVILSLTISYLTSPLVFGFIIIFLGINLFYSTVGKKIPYVDIACNTATHPLRTFFGLVLSGAQLSLFYPLVLTTIFVQISLTTLRRIREYKKDTINARPSLRKYSLATLKLMSTTFYYLAIFHFVVTVNATGTFWRLIVLTFATVIIFLLKPKTIFQTIVNIWMGCESIETLQRQLGVVWAKNPFA